MKRDELIEEMVNITKDNLNTAMSFTDLEESTLNAKKDIEKWSILECLDHLNRYSAYYHPEIKRRLDSATKSDINLKTNSSWLGKKFVKSLRLVNTNGTIGLDGTMNSPKNMNPTIIKSSLSRADLDTFISDQKELLSILKECREYDLMKVKTSISISKMVKLRLCDTLRVVVYHNQRHIWQASNLLK